MVKETKKEGKARKKGRRCVSVLPLVLEGVCACMRARMKKRKKKKDQKGRKVKEKGNTIVPVKLFISERGFAKLVIALATGKKSHNKRDSIKDKDQKREMDRIKNMGL